jgi:hypothetical protein
MLMERISCKGLFGTIPLYFNIRVIQIALLFKHLDNVGAASLEPKEYGWYGVKLYRSLNLLPGKRSVVSSFSLFYFGYQMDWGGMARATVLYSYVCMYVCMYVYVCMCVCMYVYTHRIYIYICVCVCAVWLTEIKPRLSFWQRWGCMGHLYHGCVASQCRT